MIYNKDPIGESIPETPDEDILELMENHDFDQDTAEGVQEIMEEYGVDEDEAIEIAESDKIIKGIHNHDFKGTT